MAKFTGTGLFAQSGNNARMYDLEFTNTAGVTQFSNEVVVERCRFEGDGSGTALGLTGTTTVRDCYFTNWDYGVTTSSRTGVFSCVFDGGETAGIYSDDALTVVGSFFDSMPVGVGGFLDDGSVIQGSYFDSTDGINADQGADYTTIADNYFETNEDAIVLDQAISCNITNNVIRAGSDGIVLDGSGVSDEVTDCRITGNVIDQPGAVTDNTFDGIRVTAGDRTLITDNHIVPSAFANDTRYGINIASGTANVVVGNYLGGTAAYGSGPFNDGGTNTVTSYPGGALGDNFGV